MGWVCPGWLQLTTAVLRGRTSMSLQHPCVLFHWNTSCGLAKTCTRSWTTRASSWETGELTSCIADVIDTSKQGKRFGESKTKSGKQMGYLLFSAQVVEEVLLGKPPRRKIFRPANQRHLHASAVADSTATGAAVKLQLLPAKAAAGVPEAGVADAAAAVAEAADALSWTRTSGLTSSPTSRSISFSPSSISSSPRNAARSMRRRCQLPTSAMPRRRAKCTLSGNGH